MTAYAGTNDRSAIGSDAGDGLAASQALLADIVMPALGVAGGSEDGAVIPEGVANASVVTADLYTVDPLEFPGGNIGTLAAAGCSNDLLAAGAHIRWVSVGLHLSAELDRAVLWRVLTAFRETLLPTGAVVLCGDTKVHDLTDPLLTMWVTAAGVPLGASTCGLGNARAGDELIVTGPVGGHSIAVLSAREGLGFERVVASDAQVMLPALREIVRRGLVRGLRDLTRGGLVGALWDGVTATGLSWEIDRAAVPVTEPVTAAASMLGLDPLALTNEGCLLMIVDSAHGEEVLHRLACHSVTAAAARVGRVVSIDGPPAAIELQSTGIRQILSYPSGLGVPRLC